MSDNLFKERLPISELRNVRLRVVRTSDIPFCFDLCTYLSTWYLWSDGQMVTFEDDFAETIRRKSETRSFFIIERKEKEEFQSIGLSYIYSHEPLHGHAYFSLAVHPDLVGKGYGYAATTLITDIAFFYFNLNKLYCEIININPKVISLAKKMGFKQQGLLKNHYKISGEGVDLAILAITREQWYGKYREKCYKTNRH